MCYAIPGKVAAVSSEMATIDYFGEKRRARTGGFKLQKGNYVYVQAGVVVAKLEQKEAKEATALWKEMMRAGGRAALATPTPALRLFFLYAHPCGEVLVAKGKLSSSQLNSIRKALLRGGIPNQNPSLFAKAIERLGATASRLQTPPMDERAIRQYYWFDHDDVAEDKTLCRILPAKALKVEGSNALVSTPVGLRNINISFLDKVKPGDLLATHYQYACERISPKDFGHLWKVKK